MPAKYLITGGAGFIGSHLTDRLAGRGHHVTVLDDLSSGSARNLEGAMAGGRVRLVDGSVLDRELVKRCVGEVDACIHLAAALGVQRIVDRPLEALLANVRGADDVMAESNAAGCRVLLDGLREVYGKQSGEALGRRLLARTISGPRLVFALELCDREAVRRGVGERLPPGRERRRRDDQVLPTSSVRGNRLPTAWSCPVSSPRRSPTSR